MLKQIFHKDILLVLFANIFADVTIQNFNLSFISIMPGFQDKAALLEANILAFLINLNMISRIVILPVVYQYIEEKSDSLILKNFIFNLKKSLKTKVLILFVSVIYSYLFVLNSFNKSNFDINYAIFLFVLSIFLSLFIGLMGDYLALYLYWYLNKKNNKLKYLLSFIFNKYTLIIAILSNFLVIGIVLNFDIFNYIVKFTKFFITK